MQLKGVDKEGEKMDQHKTVFFMDLLFASAGVNAVCGAVDWGAEHVAYASHNVVYLYDPDVCGVVMAGSFDCGVEVRFFILIQIDF